MALMVFSREVNLDRFLTIVEWFYCNIRVYFLVSYCIFMCFSSTSVAVWPFAAYLKWKWKSSRVENFLAESPSLATSQHWDVGHLTRSERAVAEARDADIQCTSCWSPPQRLDIVVQFACLCRLLLYARSYEPVRRSTTKSDSCTIVNPF